MAGVITDLTVVAANTSTGTQAISLSLDGETPKAAVFIVTRTTLDADDVGAPDNHAVICYGATDGTNEWACAASFEHAQLTTDGYTDCVSDECILILDPTNGTVDGEANISSFSADTVTINWGNAPASAYKVICWAIAGSDVEAEAGNATQTGGIGATTGSPSHSLSNAPSGVIVAAGGSAITWGSGPTSAARLAVGFGSYDGSTIRQASQAFQYEDAQTTGYTNLRVDSTYINAAPGAAQPWLDLTGVSSSALTFTKRNNAANLTFGWLAIGGCLAEAGLHETTTTTGTDAVTLADTTLYPRGFLLGLARANYSERDTTILNVRSGTIGWGAAGQDGSEACGSIQVERNQSPTDTQNLHDNVVVHLPPHTGGTGGHEADSPAYSTGTFSYNVTSAVGTSKGFPFLVFGSERLDSVGGGQIASFAAGSPSIDVQIQPSSGGATLVSFTAGSPTLLMTSTVSPTGFQVGFAAGSPTIGITNEVSPTGFQVGAAQGTPTIGITNGLRPTGFQVGAAFGSPSVGVTFDVTPTGFQAGAAFGSPTLLMTTTVAPTGLAEGVAFGAPDVDDNAVADNVQVDWHGLLASSGMVAGRVVSSAPAIGIVAWSGMVAGRVLQSHSGAGVIASSGMVAGRVVGGRAPDNPPSDLTVRPLGFGIRRKTGTVGLVYKAQTIKPSRFNVGFDAGTVDVETIAVGPIARSVQPSGFNVGFKAGGADIDDGTNTFHGIDGDFTVAASHGVTVPERDPYDTDNPHMSMTQAGILTRNVASTSGGWGAGATDDLSGSGYNVIEKVVEDYWYHYWMDLHGSTYPLGPDSVPLGTELAPVTIELEPGDRIYNREGSKWGSSFPDSNGALQFCNVGSNDEDASIHPSQCAILRDIVFHGDWDTDTRAKIPGLRWNLGYDSTQAGGPAGGNQNCDNFRFDLIEVVGGRQGGGGGLGNVDRYVGIGAITNQPQGDLGNTNDAYLGKIKLYDCRLRAIESAEGVYGEGETFQAKWGIRCITMLSLDVRTRAAWAGMDEHKFCRDAQEHCIYLDGLRDHPTGNHFIGLENEHETQTQVWGTLDLGPTRTFIQNENRPNQQGYAGSVGTVTVIRCTARGVGKPEGASALTFQGSGGPNDGDDATLYIEDFVFDGRDKAGNIKPDPDDVPDQFYDSGDAHGGVLKISQGFSGGVQGAIPTEGRIRYHRTGDPDGVTYCSDTVIINGITVQQNDGGKRSMFGISGVRTLKLVKFKANGTNAVWNVEQLDIGGTSTLRGDNQIGELDISELKDPDTGADYTGDLSDYPGWLTTATKITWGPHLDVYNAGSSSQPTQKNAYTLTDAEIDVWGDLISEVVTNRVTDTGTGKYTIDNAAWTHQSEPDLPQVEFDSAYGNQVIEEGGHAWVLISSDDLSGSSNTWHGDSDMRIRVTVAVNQGDVDDFEYELGDKDIDAPGYGRFAKWVPIAMPYIAYQEPLGLNPVWESVLTGGSWGGDPYPGLEMPTNPNSGTNKDTYIPIRITPKSGLAPGSYGIIISVSNPQIEFPKGSGIWRNCTLATQTTRQINYTQT